jgi:hypothetical protein
MCIDYRKLNSATKKDHFPLPFIDEMLERLAKHSLFYFLDGFQVTTKSPSTPTISARLGSHALMERMHTKGCHLGFTMPLHHSKGS